MEKLIVGRQTGADFILTGNLLNTTHCRISGIVERYPPFDTT